MSNHKGTTAQMIALCFCVFVVGPGVVFAQLDRPPTEAEALAAIKVATNPTLKLTAAEDFIARFPNSGARISVAELIAAEIVKVRNGAVALALLERARAVFTTEHEREIFKLVALETHVLSRQTEETFALAAQLLVKSPDNLNVLVTVIGLGVETSATRKTEYVELSLAYALKAIGIIESGNKPANVSDEKWAIYKNNLGLIYRNTAILYRLLHNTQEAKARAIKATRLMPYEPSNFATLAQAIEVEYASQLEKHERMPDGEPKREAQKRLDVLLDELIDAFARTVGLAMGVSSYQNLVQSIVPPLTSYYKTRHNSTEGLQQLINKYRPKP